MEESLFDSNWLTEFMKSEEEKECSSNFKEQI